MFQLLKINTFIAIFKMNTATLKELEEDPILHGHLRVIDGNIVVREEEFRVVLTNADGSINEAAVRSAKRVLRFLQIRPSLIQKGKGGYYAAVNDTRIAVFMTEDEALTFSEDNGGECLVTSISFCPFDFFIDEELSFKVTSSRELSEITELSAMPISENELPEFCYSDKRRLAKLSIQSGDKWFAVWFILDMGSNHSYICRRDRELMGLQLHDSTSAQFARVGNVWGYGNKFAVYPNEDSSSVFIRDHNLNLLGCNFLNNYMVVDDFQSRHLMLLKRGKVGESPISHS
jgi:hypothetical protein